MFMVRRGNLQKDLGDMFVRIVVTGVSDSGEHFFDKEVLDIDAPDRSSPNTRFAAASSIVSAMMAN